MLFNYYYYKPYIYFSRITLGAVDLRAVSA